VNVYRYTVTFSDEFVVTFKSEGRVDGEARGRLLRRAKEGFAANYPLPRVRSVTVETVDCPSLSL
jgi:hypothetical protein